MSEIAQRIKNALAALGRENRDNGGLPAGRWEVVIDEAGGVQVSKLDNRPHPLAPSPRQEPHPLTPSPNTERGDNDPAFTRSGGMKPVERTSPPNPLYVFGEGE
jgi:hypothetical protein